jgi:hypothetical protein
MLCLAAFIVRPAAATPIHPTAEQRLRQAEQPVMPYLPAQAGWQDAAADSQDAGTDGFNTTEILRDAEAARNRRAMLLEIARPDPRVILALGAIIFLLRRMRMLRESAGLPAPAQAATH